MLGDGLAVLTSACESRLALNQMMTESLPLYVPLITSITSTPSIKMFEHTALPVKMTVSMNAWHGVLILY